MQRALRLPNPAVGAAHRQRSACKKNGRLLQSCGVAIRSLYLRPQETKAMNTPDGSPTERWKEGVRQPWMESAAGWRKWAPQWEVQSRAATEAIVHAAQVTPGMQILDLASGTGEPALTLAIAVRPGGGTSPPRIWCPRWWRPFKSRRSNARLPI